ncbi:MAG TPA: PEGA domain-containing protein [Kofleriaceae bacterium]|nr:PEGA domain-containing protein [Kofleriaceae bacterium]
MPKLLVQLTDPPAGVEVRLDARTIALNTPVEVDFGDYTVVVKAEGFANFKNTVHIADEGRTTTLVITLLPEQPVAPSPGPVATATTEAPPRSHRKLYAIGALATGGVAVATGLVFGGLARSAWHDAQAVCGGTTCGTQADLDRANSLRNTANGRATISTVLVIAGSAAAITGVALWVTAPSEHSVAVAAHPTGDGAAVTLSGRF